MVAGQVGVGNQGFHQIEREFEAVGFFGVDVDADVVFFAEQEQFFQARQQLAHHAVVLGAGIARVDGGEFDGNAVAFINALAGGILADGMDGVDVVLIIAFGIGFGHGGFAEHIKGIEIAEFFAFFAVFQGFFDGLAGNELFAEHAHGVVYAFEDERLAAFAHDAGERVAEALAAGRGGELAGYQQAPGGGVYK